MKQSLASQIQHQLAYLNFLIPRIRTELAQELHTSARPSEETAWREIEANLSQLQNLQAILNKQRIPSLLSQLQTG